MRFHYIAMPHLPVIEDYSACAFTQKVHKLTRMLLEKGHEVFLYGVERTDISHKNLKFISVIHIGDVRDAWGEGDNRFELGYDWQEKGFKHDINKPPSKATLKFRKNAIREINTFKKDDDFLLLSQGMYHKPIADAVGLYLTVEPGIGYRGSYARFRAFESTYIQNFTYGSEHPRVSIDGNYYDRVIPNYFDPKDFTFRPQADTNKYLLYIGRVIPRKGVSTAMKIADHLNMRLIIAGQGSLNDIAYKTDKAQHIGVVSGKNRDRLYGGASATLVPTIYLEPFGGTAVESMLTGTPAVTTNFGAFTDTVANGISGFRCDTLKDFVDNTKKALEMNREKVRKYGERYTMNNINKLYEKWWIELYRLYESTVDPNKKAWHYVR